MPPKAKGASRIVVALRVLAFLVASAFKLAFVALSIATPLLAMWIASSLAAYRGASVAWTIVAGLAAWPVVPIAWELFGRWRSRGAAKPPTLTTFDRFVLRSLAVGLAFNALLLVCFPATVFAALSTRGDWMLGGAQAPWAERTRDGLVRAAGGLEWLHEATHENEFEQQIEQSATHTDAPVLPSNDDLHDAIAELHQRMPEARGTFEPRTDGWPWAATLHPAVTSITTEHDQSIESVGKYLAAAEPDPTMRVKAIHDYVASRIAYDAVALSEGRYPDQSATTVFRDGIGVCAGYANLAAALGDAAGVEIVVVGGYSRHPGHDASAEGHAWNAARIGDRWVLFDATWDAGSVEGRTFTREYETDYLMTPPDVFVATHYPDEDRWQLLSTALTRAQWLRLAAMRPGFYARGLQLKNVDTWHIEAKDSLHLDIDNPLRLELHVGIVAQDERWLVHCDNVASGVDCSLPSAGRYEVAIFEDHTYLGALQLDVKP